MSTGLRGDSNDVRSSHDEKSTSRGGTTRRHILKFINSISGHFGKTNDSASMTDRADEPSREEWDAWTYNNANTDALKRVDNDGGLRKVREKLREVDSTRTETGKYSIPDRKTGAHTDRHPHNYFPDVHRSGGYGGSHCSHDAPSFVQSASFVSAHSPQPCSPIGSQSNLPTPGQTSTPSDRSRCSSSPAGGLSGRRYIDDPRWPDTPDETARSTMLGLVHKYH